MINISESSPRSTPRRDQARSEMQPHHLVLRRLHLLSRGCSLQDLPR